MSIFQIIKKNIIYLTRITRLIFVLLKYDIKAMYIGGHPYHCSHLLKLTYQHYFKSDSIKTFFENLILPGLTFYIYNIHLPGQKQCLTFKKM